MRYPQGFKCSKCECTEYYYLKSRGKYRCKNCKHQSSVTSGTVMDRSHLKITIWLWAIYLFSNDKRGSSACYISQVLRLPYKTAWFVLQRLRYAMAERENKYMLSGTVELDDTYVGTPTKGKKRGRGTEKGTFKAYKNKGGLRLKRCGMHSLTVLGKIQRYLP